MIISKQNLHDRFTASLDALGVYFGDNDTGLSEDEYIASGRDPKYYEEVALLPGGHAFAICTFGADHVIAALGQGERYGFSVSENPTVTDREIRLAGGHDFAVIAGRYIVDPWYAFSSNGAQGVYDLRSVNDREAISRIYGPPECWSWFDTEARKSISLKEADVPKRVKIRIPVPQPEMAGPEM